MSLLKTKNNTKPDILDDAWNRGKAILGYIFLFSFSSNVFMLAMPIYSMQIMDRVMSSGSEATLLYLTLLIVGMFALMSMIGAARSFCMIRVGEWLDRQLAPKLMALTLATSAQRGGVVSGAQNQRDLAVVKNFVTGAPLNTLLDLPWTVVFLVVIFIIHWVEGLISIFGCAVLFILAVMSESVVSKTLSSANENSVRTMGVAEIATRNAEVVEAMGMTNAVIQTWNKRNIEVSELQMLASNRSNVIMSITKFFRMFIQVLIYGSGALLALQHEITSGAIIACSILISRALGPFEAAIGTWKAYMDFLKSLERLKASIEKAPARFEGILLPEPKGQLTVERVVFAPAGSAKPTIKGVSFGIVPGDILGIIGASASGKTTLAKLMVGVWKPASGNVRLDGADVYNWNREQFGKYVGYVPQDVELFDGTVRNNIARLQSGIPDEQIIEAAKLAGAHDMILRLADGYETQIGIGGTNLSAGQRQRIALARAFFGTPRLLILDEPNANLDSAGEAALVTAINNAKKKGITTIIISHRPNILNAVDKILVLNDGLVEDFGSAAEVAGKYARAQQALNAQQKPASAQIAVDVDGGTDSASAGNTNG